MLQSSSNKTILQLFSSSQFSVDSVQFKNGVKFINYEASYNNKKKKKTAEATQVRSVFVQFSSITVLQKSSKQILFSYKASL